jgi:glycosidase
MPMSIMEDLLHVYFPLGFAVCRKASDRYGLTSLLRGPESVAAVADAAAGAEAGADDPQASTADIAGDLQTLRELSERMNRERARGAVVLPHVQAGDLIAVGTIVDVLRYLAGLYCHEENAGVIGRSLEWVRSSQGPPISDMPPPAFVDLFPPVEVTLGRRQPQEYLQRTRRRIANRDTVAIEMILLSLAMSNPAFKPYRDLFDDGDLRTRTPYVPLVLSQEQFFAAQPALEPLGMTLFHCLRAPMLASPDSLAGQLEYIRAHWAALLPAFLRRRMQLARGVMAEEKRLRGLGPGPAQVLEFTRDAYRDLSYPEPEAFSRDADWMSNVVLIAKSVYVWLDQLSRKYRRSVRILSDVPDEELDRLARWGFSGLWLIGVWERSRASQKIKQWMGNPEAVASAYSLHDYVIAGDLGGETAYQNLKDRAWRRGIRLASDMVPNHMGIDSRWLIEHPHWFVQLEHPPYPWYRYTGGDLCDDGRAGVFIEDGYWEHRDAAVVFKRFDRQTGRECYIYHGNDGTSMPWNDTAQLDFTLPEVREAVIQTILHVARKFSIIRFDAAMTLAKKHYQRLWFPAPGDEGAIPSRAERGLSRAEFDRVMPKEFWREVVDRIQAEVPETLLLAEAFWLMEGYFVRTLGMHRVYNSAFMNMLKMEENSKYRQTIKNVLEFSPEVLKRFVNFMNNPDERTAIEQFGKGDKYYGVAVMMVTMPGLPMFGHGQIEGFTEKYGMEYRRAYWDEQVDEEMVRRHEAEIFPLMRRRRLFSGAGNFALYDFRTPDGHVDENVFAYSNRAGDERAVILYNNAYGTTRGAIYASTPINTGAVDQPALASKGLAGALALDTAADRYYAFRDHRTQLVYLRSGRQIADDGLYVELQGYQYHAFVDFRELRDTDGSWSRLAQELGGQPVWDLEEARRRLQLRPVLEPFGRYIEAILDAAWPGSAAPALAGTAEAPPASSPKRTMSPAASGSNREVHLGACRKALGAFLQAAWHFTGAHPSGSGAIDRALQDLGWWLALPTAPDAESVPPDRSAGLEASLARNLQAEPGLLPVAAFYLAVRVLGHLGDDHPSTAPHALAAERFASWLFKKDLEAAIRERIDRDSLAPMFAQAREDATLLHVLLAEPNVALAARESQLGAAVAAAFARPAVREYLLFNEHNGEWYLNKERLERFLQVSAVAAVIEIGGRAGRYVTEGRNFLAFIDDVTEAARRSGYRVDAMLVSLASRPG